jgi:hypothetical protein
MGNGGAKMAKEKAIDQKAALEAAYESETVRVLIDKLAPTFMTGLTIDKTVHEFLTATSTAIAEQKGIEKLNGYLDGLGKVDSYLGEQVSIYESHLRLDLKMMYDDMLTKARQKTKWRSCLKTPNSKTFISVQTSSSSTSPISNATPTR